MEDVKVYTLDEVAEIVKLSKRTLYAYIKAGVLRASRIGKYWRVTSKNLQDFVNNGTLVESGSNLAEN